jgi:hypothetical protein
MQRPESYRSDLQDRIRECLRDLYLLEKGEKHFQSRTGEQPWRDVTKEMISSLKSSIALYERMLALLDKLPH